MNRMFQPLYDEFPTPPLGAEGPERGSGAPEEGGLLTSDSLAQLRFLGEIGGVLFPSSLLERYQQLGGAVYRPLVPFSSAPQATFDESSRSIVAARRNRRRAPDSSIRVAAQVLHWILTPFFELAPWLRLIVPRPLNGLSHRPLRLEKRDDAISGSLWTVDGDVVAMAFHEHLPLMALALKDNAGHHRVVLYDVAAEKLLPLALTHPLQTNGIYAVAWKPKAKDCLLVACTGGVLAWSLGYFRSKEPKDVGPLVGVGRSSVGIGSGANEDGGFPAGSGTTQSWWSNFVTDDTPACVFYRCCGGECVTTLAVTSCGRYVAAASERSIYVTVHDISQAPDDALVLHTAAVEGGTSAVLFAPNDAYLLRSLRHHKSLKLLYMDTLAVDTIPLAQPVAHMCSLDSPRDEKADDGRDGWSAGHLYALQYEQTEGVAIVRVVTTTSGGADKNGVISPSRSSLVFVTCLVATGVVRGIGGRVENLAFSGQRMYLTVASGHLVVLAVRVTDDAVYVRSVGVLAVKDRRSIVAASPNFPKGSLVAFSNNGEVHFVPSYYRR